MKKLAVSWFVVTLSTAAFARADDASVVAERRALKPGTGLYVVDTTIDLHVAEAWVKDAKGYTRSGGWRPSHLAFDLWGKSDSSNAIVVKWRDGNRVVFTTECVPPDIDETKDSASNNWNDQGEVQCEIKEGPVFPRTGVFEADVLLREPGKPEQLLRTIRFAVRSARSNSTAGARVTYFVDHDYKLAENVAYWDWDAHSFVVRSFTKHENDIGSEGKMRCAVNGSALGTEGTVVVGGGASYQVRDGEHDKDIRWSQLEGTVYLPRTAPAWKPGRYECAMTVKGKVLRTVRFQLDSKLGIVTSSEQQPRAGAFVSRATYLPDVELPPGVDALFDRAAFGSLAFLGRPWLGTPPVVPAGASTVSSSPSGTTSSPAKAKATPSKGKAPTKPGRRR